MWFIKIKVLRNFVIITMHLLIGEIQKDQKKNCAIFWLNKPRSPSFVKSFRTKVKEIILTPSPPSNHLFNKLY